MEGQSEYTVVSENSAVYYGATYWNDIPVVREEINRRVSGDPMRDWVDRFRAATGQQRFSRALMLNCGNGHVERDLLTRGVVEVAVGIDCSVALLKEAEEEAVQRGLAATYHCMDVNTATFPAGPFDLIVNFSAAHHIQRVDRVFRALRELLVPDGLFVNYDYVGPHRNQYGWPAWEAAHAVNQQLPTEARQQLRYPHLPTMLADDPSEAVHSELVLETMGRYFELDDFTPVGGAVAYILLTHNAQLFAAEPADRSRWAESVMAADGKYLVHRPEDTLFAYWIARPRHPMTASQAELERWTMEESRREEEAARNGGEYYPHTSLQAVTLELSDQAILAEHRTAWAYELQAELVSLKSQLEQAQQGVELPRRSEARRILGAVVRRLEALRPQSRRR